MPWDGNGNYTNTYFPTQDRDSEIPILASKFENFFQVDLPGTFNNVPTRDGQGVMATNFNFNNFRGLNLSDPLGATDAMNKQTSDANIAAAVSAAVPVGSEMYYMASSAPAGWIFEEGQEISRTTYSDLWSYAQTNGLVKTEVAWQAGEFGFFSDGDGATTFRLPDMRGEFVRVHDNGKGTDPDAASRAGGDNPGSVQIDALQNITGYFEPAIRNSAHNVAASGAFTRGIQRGSGIVSGANASYRIDFDASNVARTSTETRPVNVYRKMMIKYS